MSVVPHWTEMFPSESQPEAPSQQPAAESPVTNWPDPLKSEAFHGLAGEVVGAIEPHSESDPAALLLQFLVGFGNVIGRRAHWAIEADRHPCNLFAVIVGQTSKARKGTSWGHIHRLLGELDSDWERNRVLSGLASGEGLIWHVRDEIVEQEKVRDKGRTVGYEQVKTDPGEADKRLLVVEPEFARVLQVAERESNTLSAIIRQSWDTGTLRILTKKQSVKATEAHISIIGHITRDELRRLLTDSAAGNGFGNRFLWACAARSKHLPFGGQINSVDFSSIQRRLGIAAEFARSSDLLDYEPKAATMWEAVYDELSEGKPGLFGAVTSRGEAQTMRLALIYALLDRSHLIREEHLLAALAVWQYCEHSARFIFGDAMGDATADEILRELLNHPDGMTRNEIRDYFARHKRSEELCRALDLLQEHGRACRRLEPGEGRTAERWFAARYAR